MSDQHTNPDLEFQGVFDELARVSADRLAGLMQELAVTRATLLRVTRERDELAQRLGDRPPTLGDTGQPAV
ncbi:hypothetical protein ACFXGA_06085 [Actinosynnema sp. NPDC059335]|uniref:hypothetical protein n=1 Tax=Actinosynnema sp. NPDC059335 TaxID=3346804 RepID=UPI00366FE4F4